MKARTKLTPHTLIRHLRELIAALDRRVPHLAGEGERDIAREAAELRTVALKRIAELSPPPSGTTDVRSGVRDESLTVSDMTVLK